LAVAIAFGWSLAIAPAAGERRQEGAPLQLEIVAPSELSAVASQLSRVDAAQFAVLAARLGLDTPGAPIRVVLAHEDSEIARQTPPWIAGFAHGASSTVVLFPSRSASYPYDSIEDVLRHEIAHVLIFRAAPGAAIPRWLHEGLAMSAERRATLADRTHLALAVFAGPRNLAALDDELDAGGRRAARAYAIAAAFVRDAVARYGSQVPAALLAAVARGATVDDAFRQATGVSVEEAERVFWRGRWWYHAIPFLTSSVALWLAIAALALVAVRRRAAHRAALHRKWEDEDALSEAGHATDREARSPPAECDRDASGGTQTGARRCALPGEASPAAPAPDAASSSSTGRA
jgi:hypothetical protein